MEPVKAHSSSRSSSSTNTNNLTQSQVAVQLQFIADDLEMEYWIRRLNIPLGLEIICKYCLRRRRNYYIYTCVMLGLVVCSLKTGRSFNV